MDRQILEAEGPGILAWIVRGCLEWQQHGLQVPARLFAATKEYREETDVLGQWFAEKVQANSSAVRGVEAADAYLSARYFLCEAGMLPLSKPAFMRRVGRFGMEARRSNGVQRFPGFTLRQDEDL